MQGNVENNSVFNSGFFRVYIVRLTARVQHDHRDRAALAKAARRLAFNHSLVEVTYL